VSGPSCLEQDVLFAESNILNCLGVPLKNLLTGQPPQTRRQRHLVLVSLVGWFAGYPAPAIPLTEELLPWTDLDDSIVNISAVLDRNPSRNYGLTLHNVCRCRWCRGGQASPSHGCSRRSARSCCACARSCTSAPLLPAALTLNTDMLSVW
jgi:hypothetical protein